MENGNIYAFLAMKKEKKEISLENIRLPAIERIKISMFASCRKLESDVFE